MPSRRTQTARKEDHVRRQAAVTSAPVAHEPADLALQRDPTARPAPGERFNYAKCPACGTGTVLQPQLSTGDRFICESCGEPLLITGPFAPDVLRTPVSVSGMLVIGLTVIAAIVVAWIVFSSPATEDPGAVPASPDQVAPDGTRIAPARPAPEPTYVYCVPGEDIYHTRRDCNRIPPTATIEAMTLREAKRHGRLPCATCGQ